MSIVAPSGSSTGELTPDLPPHLRDVATDEASLRRFLHGLPGVDPVGVEQRSAGLATRSIKKAAKLAAIDLAISMVDLTTLEGSDTPGKVRTLAAKARRPDPENPDTPHVAALCIYPDMVAVAVEALAGSGVGIASVATAFPTGRTSLAVRLADTEVAVSAGATEIDMVIDRGAFLAGHYGKVFDDIVRSSRPAAARGSRSSWKPANWPPTTTSVARPGWRCWPAAISSRPRPARSPPLPPCR